MSRFDFLIGITGEGGLVEKKIELRISLRLSWPHLAPLMQSIFGSQKL